MSSTAEYKMFPDYRAVTYSAAIVFSLLIHAAAFLLLPYILGSGGTEENNLTVPISVKEAPVQAADETAPAVKEFYNLEKQASPEAGGHAGNSEAENKPSGMPGVLTTENSNALITVPQANTSGGTSPGFGTGSGTGTGTGSGSGSEAGIEASELPFIPAQVLEVIPKKTEDDVKGYITLKLKIGVDGKVTEHKIITNTTGSKEFLRNVMEAAYKSKWEPVKINRTKVIYWVEKTYSYE